MGNKVKQECSPVSQNQESPPYTNILRNRVRFFMMFLLLLCLSAMWSNILSFNIAVLCMHPHRYHNLSITLTVLSNLAYITENGSIPESKIKMKQDMQNYTLSEPNLVEFFNRKVFWYTADDKSKLIGAVAVGAMLGNFPIVWLTGRYQVRTTFGVLGIISGLVTSFIPIAARLGFDYFLIVRAIQGMAFAANFCVIGSFTSKWTYFKQNGMFISVLVAHFQMAPAMTMPIGGYICSTYGWPFVYYAHGIYSLLLFIITILLYRNSPNKHPFVSDAEVSKIATGKQTVSKSEQRQIPYSKILGTAAVWAVWIAAFGASVCSNLIFLMTPTFLHAVLGYQVQHTGFTSAFPPLLQFIIKLASGVASDKIRILSETAKVKVFNSIAFFGSAIFLIVLALLIPNYNSVAICLLIICTGVLGGAAGGLYRSGPIIARHFSPFVTGNISLAITLTILLVPIMVSMLAPDNTVDQWKNVCFVIVMLSLIQIFMLAREQFYC
uniref:MFS domain-containing protein n=1 Tax=Syphacia muris TaxID=451379 RepID=A0A0N5AZC5_9BILA